MIAYIIRLDKNAGIQGIEMRKMPTIIGWEEKELFGGELENQDSKVVHSLLEFQKEVVLIIEW